MTEIDKEKDIFLQSYLNTGITLWQVSICEFYNEAEAERAKKEIKQSLKLLKLVEEIIVKYGELNKEIQHTGTKKEIDYVLNKIIDFQSLLKESKQ